MDISIDTLAIYERLKKADLPENAAKELSEILRENVQTILEHQKEMLVTKYDIRDMATKQDLREMEYRIKADIIKWVAGMLVAQAVAIATLVKLL